MCKEEIKEIIDNILRHTKIQLEADYELEEMRQCGIFSQNKQYHKDMVKLHETIEIAEKDIRELKNELFSEFKED